MSVFNFKNYNVFQYQISFNCFLLNELWFSVASFSWLSFAIVFFAMRFISGWITSWLSIFRLGPYQWCRICLRSTSSHPDDFRGYIAKVPLSLSLSYLCNECTCQIAWNVGWFRTNDENYFLPIHQHISSKYANTSYDMYILMNWTSI